MPDSFLTSKTGQIMLNNCPDYYEDSLTFKAYCQAVGVELDDLKAGIEEILNQFFVQTAIEWGLDLWEAEYGLISFAGKPLDQRRSRLISKNRGVGTVNEALIKLVAESYIYGLVDVTENAAGLTFTVRFIDTIGIPPDLENIQAAIDEIKPAHLGSVYEFTYTTWGEVKNATWGEVKTGTWGDLRTRQIV